MRVNIKPTYDELIFLNPRLTKKSKKQVEELVVAIIKCGYEWDKRGKCFYNKEINISVRTQGLDVFDPNLFKETHKTWSRPNYISGMRLAHKYIPKIFILLLIDILFGWIFIPIEIWIISLVTLTAILFIIRRIAHIRVHKLQ